MANISEEQLEQLCICIERYLDESDEAAAQEAFNLFDMDHDYRVSIDEIRRVLARISEGEDNFDIEKEDQRLQAAFKAADANGDGVLELKEFLTFLTDIDNQ